MACNHLVHDHYMSIPWKLMIKPIFSIALMQCHIWCSCNYIPLHDMTCITLHAGQLDDDNRDLNGRRPSPSRSGSVPLVVTAQACHCIRVRVATESITFHCRRGRVRSSWGFTGPGLRAANPLKLEWPNPRWSVFRIWWRAKIWTWSRILF